MSWAPRFNIGSATVGPGHRCYIVAEFGSNHDGDLDQALRLMASAAKAGADAVKFPLFAAYGFIASHIKNDKGRLVQNPRYAVAERMELPLDWLPKLWTEANNLGVELLMTPFGIERLVAWVEMGARAIKIASGDLTHMPLLRAAGASGLPILLACGMSDTSEVTEALTVIERAGGRQIALLHCVSRYPPEDAEINLKVIPAMAREHQIPVGLSDHSAGSTAPLGAAALGASIIEKHFTIDRSLAGPDHAFSMEADNFAAMVSEIRRLESMLGDGMKRPTEAERVAQLARRRSIVATMPMKAGKILMRDDLKCVRPGGGLTPAFLPLLIEKKLKRNVREDEMILMEDVE